MDFRGRRIERYIAGEVFFSFLVAFLFFFLIFLINQLLLLAEDILEKQVPVLDVLEMLWYSLPSIVALSVPFATLVGCLMAIGRLNSDNEIIAMRASGVSLYRMFAPVLLLGIVLSLFTFVINDYLLPVGNLNLVRRYRELILSNPDLEFQAYSAREFQDLVLVSGEVDESRIQDLLIIETGRRSRERIINAREAVLEEDEERSGVITLRLSDVSLQDPVGGNPEDYDYSRSSEMTYNILLRDISLTLQNPTAREMSSVDVHAMVREQREDLRERRRERDERVARLRQELSSRTIELERAVSSGEVTTEQARDELSSLVTDIEGERSRTIVSRSLQLNLIEFHKKFSIPAACFAFVVFGFPVGLYAKRSGRAIGFGIGLFVSFLYWASIFGGQTLGVQHPQLPASLAMWLPNILVILAGLWLLWERARR